MATRGVQEDAADEADDGAFQKPAKLKADDDLVAYVRSMEQPLVDIALQIDEALKIARESVRDEIGGAALGTTPGGRGSSSAAVSGLVRSVAALGSADDSGALLVKGVHREIAKREASLASHKHSSGTLESLLRVSTAAQLARFGGALVPYIPFLSFHRHGSHVLQSVLGLVWEYLAGARAVEDAALCGLPDSDGDAPSEGEPAAVRAALRSFVRSALAGLRPHLHAAIYHEAATHVLRTVVCCLSGVSPHETGAAGASLGAKGGGKVGAKGAKGGDEAGPAHARSSTDLSSPSIAAGVASYARFQGKRASKGLRLSLVHLAHGVCLLGQGGDGPTAQAEGEEDSPTPLAAQAVEPLEAEELGALSCDANASPTLQLLLAACAHAAPATARVLMRRAINAGLQGLSEEERSGSADVASSSKNKAQDGEKRKRGEGESAQAQPVAAMDPGSTDRMWLDRLSTHSVGSHVLEAVVAHADPPLFALLLKTFFSGRLAALCADGRAHYVVQRVLLSCRSVAQTEGCVRELLPHMGTLSAPESLYARRREAVLLHVVSASVGRPVVDSGPGGGADAGHGLLLHAGTAHGLPISTDLQREVLHTLASIPVLGPHKASMPLPPEWVGAESSGERQTEKDGSRKAAVAKAAGTVLKRGDSRFARFWLDINGARANGSAAAAAVASSSAGADAAAARIPTLNLSHIGVRLIGHCLRLHPSLSRLVVDSLLCLPGEELAGLACDPNASRHVIEVLAEGRLGPFGSGQAHAPVSSPDGAGTPTTSAGEWSWVCPKLTGALAGRFAALATSRFGCWAVTKLAKGLPDPRKKGVIAAELCASERAVMGSAQGRSVAKALRLEHYKSNRAGWEVSWSRSERGVDGSGGGAGAARASVLADVLAVTKGTNATAMATASSSSARMHVGAHATAPVPVPVASSVDLQVEEALAQGKPAKRIKTAKTEVVQEGPQVDTMDLDADSAGPSLFAPRLSKGKAGKRA